MSAPLSLPEILSKWIEDHPKLKDHFKVSCVDYPKPVINLACQPYNRRALLAIIFEDGHVTLVNSGQPGDPVLNPDGKLRFHPSDPRFLQRLHNALTNAHDRVMVWKRCRLNK